MLRAPLGGAIWLAGGVFFLALLAPGVHGELPPFDNSPEVYSFESYYTVARWLLLTVLLLLATNLFSMFYLRWAVGSDTEEARDSVPIVLCALSQSVAWGQALMLLLRMSGLLESDWGLWGASAGQQWSGSLQTIAAACLWQLTPFAYLYHEAVGVGQFFGATGIAGRATEATALLGMLAVLLRGFVFVLGALLPAASDGLPPSSDATLDRLLSHAGLLALLLSVPRGASHAGMLNALLPPAPAPQRSVRGAADDDVDEPAAACAAEPPSRFSLSPPTSRLLACLGGSPGKAAASNGAPPRPPGDRAVKLENAPPPAAAASLLAQPLPDERASVRWRSVVRALPRYLMQLVGAALWLALLLSVLLRLLELLPLLEVLPAWMGGSSHGASCEAAVITPDPSSWPMLASLWASLWGADSAVAPPPAPWQWLTAAAVAPRRAAAPLPPTAASWQWLAAHFVACSVWGHHLTCHYHLLGHRRQGRANGTALQNHLLQTAVLQVQSSAIPVAAHALGLVPASLAASCTALPLCSTAPQAAAYCALFLAINGWNLVHARSRNARSRPELGAGSA